MPKDKIPMPLLRWRLFYPLFTPTTPVSSLPSLLEDEYYIRKAQPNELQLHLVKTWKMAEAAKIAARI